MGSVYIQGWLGQTVLKYIGVIIYLPLILRPYSLNSIKWCIYESLSMYGNWFGHIGETSFLGWGSIMGITCKKNDNTRCSTEVELVWVENFTIQML